MLRVSTRFAQLVGLATGAGEQHPTDDERDGLRDGDDRQDVEARSASRSPVKYWMLVP